MRNFNEWLNKKRKMDGGMGGMGSPGGAPAGGMPGGSPGGEGPMDGGGDDGNGDGNGHDHDHDHHHHSFGFLGWPWWYGNRTSSKKDCKYGKRKDGKCRKKKK